ncbi:GNAT family N-acetyltransferase [Nonomuraea aurantiaca]|uniref:GNAT family N-acetyltransferase n=1 Tax=Nonomuraea aurantiaca TaxID=2878562 RepID=UPI001CDA4F99|nr:GNAT family N-acetyltransferase [Nonomuraea aurantiaca]MCA2220367.1 GNAT family N-acetyltransferase [Nonomuraea aurantiaca]
MNASVSDYAGEADLRAMQELTSRLWSPAARWHVGDLAWGRFQHTGREPEWPTRLWRAGERVVAWGWIELPDQLNLAVDPAYDGHGLADEVLDWFAATAPGVRRTVTVLDSETHLLAALARHGYQDAGDGLPFVVNMSHDLRDLAEPEPSPGYRLRTVDAADVPGRVATHRAAFHPSRVTEESYRNVRGAWPYRADLDWIAEAPDGEVAAYCLIWLDPARRAAEIEPVGTVPAHRHRGLARAVCLAALHAARNAGATRAVVGPRGDDDYPVPARLYRGLGFHDITRSRLLHS